MEKIQAIIEKEWAEMFKNRMVLFTVIFLPLIFTALPLGILLAMGDAPLGDIAEGAGDIPRGFLPLCAKDLTTGECFQIYMVSQFMILFMMTPLIVPVNIAAYSIVGEKTTRSLEPLLATPITTVELLVGKNLAAAIPAVLGTWVGFGLYLIGANLLIHSPRVIAALLDPLWLIAIFIVGPLLALLSVNFSMMVSSRVNDPRAAEQISAVVILPLMLLFFGQVTGFLVLNRAIILLLAVALTAVDALVIYLAVRLFQRETILTRWR